RDVLHAGAALLPGGPVRRPPGAGADANVAPPRRGAGPRDPGVLSPAAVGVGARRAARRELVPARLPPGLGRQRDVAQFHRLRVAGGLAPVAGVRQLRADAGPVLRHGGAAGTARPHVPPDGPARRCGVRPGGRRAGGQWPVPRHARLGVSSVRHDAGLAAFTLPQEGVWRAPETEPSTIARTDSPRATPEPRRRVDQPPE